MEKLNDITAGGEDDTKIDIGDILPDLEFNADGLPDWSTFKGYAEDYKKIVDEILALAADNEDLARGLKNTKFSNPIGMDDDNNYSTAKDISKLLIYSLKNVKKTL